MSRKSNGGGSAMKSMITPKGSRRASSGLFKFQFDSSSQHGAKSKTSLFGARQSTGMPSRGGKRWSGQGSAPLKDPRNLSNRGTQRKLVEELISFLQEYNYPHQITLKQLQAPTKKECEKLFAFLLEVIMPNQKIKKFEDDVPRLLKQLKYPFPISKSVMFSVGSSHTWPSMLGALHWLMELIKLCSSVKLQGNVYTDDTECDSYIEIKQIFLDYCCKSFREQIEGSPDDRAEDEQQLYNHLLEKAGVTEEEYENVKCRADFASDELRKLEEEPNQLLLATERRKMLQDECENLERNIIELNHTTSALRQRETTLESELQDLGINTDRNIQTSQLEAEKQQSEIAIQKLSAEKERCDNLFWDKQMEYSKLYAKANETQQAYNDICRQLMLDKTVQKILSGKDINLGIGSAESVADLRKVLRELQSKLCEVVNGTEAERISEESKLEQLIELANEKKDCQAQLQNKLLQIEKELEFKQASMAKELKHLNELVAKLESTNEELQHDTQIAWSDKEREHASLSEEVKATLQDFVRQEDNWSTFLRKVVEMVSHHHSLLQARWSEIRADADEDMEKIRCISPPQSKMLWDIKAR